MDEEYPDHLAWPAGPTTRRDAVRLLTTGAGVLIAAGAAEAAAKPRGGKRITSRSPWRRLGDTSVAAFRAEFDRLGSPMRREADGIRDAVDGYSRLFLAMSFVETKHATFTGVIPVARHNALAVKSGDGSGRWDRYGSFRGGARAWVRLLTDRDGPYAGTVTLLDLIEVYAPRSENNVKRYLNTLVGELRRYPSARR